MRRQADRSYSVVLRTLADHRAVTLRAFCRDCDRSVLLEHQALADRYGWDVLLETSPGRLRHSTM